MRIAIPVTEGQIANHPGHCRSFLIFDVEGQDITGEVELPNPGHGPSGPPPAFLARERVTEMLAWGIPPHAIEKFASFGIKVRVGATGDPRRAIREHLAGTLQPVTHGLDAGGGCRHEHDHD